MESAHWESFELSLIKTKDELLYEIDAYLADDVISKDEYVLDHGLSPMKDLVVSFREKVLRSTLPSLDQRQAYETTIRSNYICLDLVEYISVSFDENGDDEESTAESTDGIIFVEPPYVSISEFAQIHDVKPGTVRQWIRRGKLRNARKLGSNWQIPSTQGKPSRGYKSGCYAWTQDEGDMSSIFPLPKGTKGIDLIQGGYGEKTTATLFGKNHEIVEKIELETAAKEILERALIESPDVEFFETLITGIFRRTVNTPHDFAKCNAGKNEDETCEPSNSRTETSLTESFARSISAESSAILSGIAEIGLRGFISSEVIKDIPVLTTSASLFEIGNSIKEMNHLRKIACFLAELNKCAGTKKARQKYLKLFDGKNRDGEIEYLLILLDRIIETESAERLARIYDSYISGKIDWVDLRAFSSLIERLLPGDCELLESRNRFVAESIPSPTEKRDWERMPRLEGLGLIESISKQPINENRIITFDEEGEFAITIFGIRFVDAIRFNRNM